MANVENSKHTGDEMWTMLHFTSRDSMGDMAKFVNALGKRAAGKIRIGINAINVEAKFFEEIKSEFGADECSYVNDGLI